MADADARQCHADLSDQNRTMGDSNASNMLEIFGEMRHRHCLARTSWQNAYDVVDASGPLGLDGLLHFLLVGSEHKKFPLGIDDNEIVGIMASSVKFG